MQPVTQNPEMQKVLDHLNSNEFPLKKQMDAFKKEQDEAHICLVGNGKKEEMPLNKAVSLLANRTEVMSYEIKDIKSYTRVLKEGKTVKDIFIRHWKFLSALGVIIIPTLIKFWIG